MGKGRLQLFAYTEARPAAEGEYVRFVALFRDPETGELSLTIRAADCRFVTIELPIDAALDLGAEITGHAERLARLREGLPG